MIELDTQGRSIALVGLRGSGKSTLARLLGQKIGWHVVDMDKALVDRRGSSIPEWVEKEGWKPFREAEAALLRELRTGPRRIIATGGGVVTTPKSRRVLKDNYYTIYLHWPVDILIQRIHGDANRPQLKEGLSLKDEVQLLYDERDPIYRKCSKVVVENNEQMKSKDSLSHLIETVKKLT